MTIDMWIDVAVNVSRIVTWGLVGLIVILIAATMFWRKRNGHYHKNPYPAGARHREYEEGFNEEAEFGTTQV